MILSVGVQGDGLVPLKQPHGIEVKRLRQALQRARSECALWIDIRRTPHRYLVTDGTELFVRNRGQLESKTRDGQLAFAFVLDLAPAHRALARLWPEQDDYRTNRKLLRK